MADLASVNSEEVGSVAETAVEKEEGELEDEENLLGAMREIGARLRKFIMAESNRVSKNAISSIG